MSELLKLAERCEKATGPDRQLDLDIVNAISDKSGWFWSDDMHQTISRNDYGHGAVGNPICSLDPHTSFVDYAIALVPEGMDWRVDTMTGLPGAIVCVPGAWLSTKTAPMLVHGATPALALCAAALRARASTVVLQERGTP